MGLIKLYGWVFLLMAGTGVVCGMVIASAICFHTPKKYLSEAIIEVRPMSKEKATPQFYKTEFQRIKSHGCLANVVEKLALERAWGMNQRSAIQALHEIVTTREIRGTRLISIQVRHPGESHVIATAVIDSYLNERLESQGPVTPENYNEKEIPVLIRFLEHQKRKVDELWEQLGSMAKSIGVEVILDNSDLDPRLIGTKLEFDAQKDFLDKLEQKVNAVPKPDQVLLIHKLPRPTYTPDSPNVPLIWTLGVIGGLLFSPLLSLPVIALLRRLPPANRTEESSVSL